MKFVLILLACACAASAGEFAVFASGARLRIDRHEAAGGKIRLYSGSGYSELAAADVVRFEPEEAVAAASAPTPPQPVAEQTQSVGLHTLIDRAADRYDLPKHLLHSVIRQESGYRANAVSPKGAVGLMQLMPGTAKALGADATDPAQNVDAGARYLAQLLRQYDGYLWHALAAYNAGPGALQKYRGQIPPYRETRDYIRRIDANWRKASRAAVAARPESD